MARVVLILGGNRGDTIRLNEQAAVEIEREIGVIAASSQTYESDPWGFEADERFWNRVVEVETLLSAEELLQAIHRIEQRLGRDRHSEGIEKAASGQRYASRTMDIDILFYGEEVIQTPTLQIPHPRLAEREFVLRPLCELMPERSHPTLGLTIRELLAKLSER